MTTKTPLGDFLRTRRSQPRPEDVGVAGHGERRRVPGLGRKDVALLDQATARSAYSADPVRTRSRVSKE